MKKKPNNFIARTFDNAYEAFYFYVNTMTVNEFKEMKRALFVTDFKEMIQEYLK
jgi:hypothetical protein